MKAEKGKQRRKWLFPPRKVIWLLLVLAVPPAWGNSYTEQVRQRAENEVLNYARRRGWVNFDYSVDAWVPGNVESQPSCDQPPVVEPARTDGRHWGRIPYVIRCSSPEWEIRARAEVSLVVPVATARRNISRGETLNRSSMTLAKRDLGDIYGDFVTDIRLLRGKRARRALRSGQVITLSQAIAPLMVERGDQVVIRVSVDGVDASMVGEALQSGSMGQGIRVRNQSSGQVITGWVVEKGVVETRF